MADTLHQPEFHQAVSQQAQGPALLPLWRCTTGQCNQVRFHFARDLFGGAWRQRLMVERRRQARGHKAAADIADSIPMAVQRLRDGLIRRGFCLIAIQQQQNLGARVRPGRSAARADQGAQGRMLIVS